MKFVLATDSFKESMTSIEACNVMEKAIKKIKSDAEVIKVPMADGGEGTVEALVNSTSGTFVETEVLNPLGQKIKASYGILGDKKTAVIEMAKASGIELIKREDRNPMITTTYGTGQLIKHAIENGIKHLVIGIGGSATNDGGIGMLKALGFEFLDENGHDAGEGGQALKKVKCILTQNKNSLLDECHFQVACDVTNPLCGKNGATYIYGPQKGVTDDIKENLDQAMAQYANVTAKYLGCDYSNAAGAGAAGGLGFALLSYLNASLTPGIDLILNAVELEKELKDADVAVTGEGRLDHQTAMGKAPIGVTKLAKKYNAKVIAFAGSVTPEATACNQAGIDAFFPIVRGITTLEEAMNPECAKTNMRAAVEQVFRLL